MPATPPVSFEIGGEAVLKRRVRSTASIRFFPTEVMESVRSSSGTRLMPSASFAIKRIASRMGRGRRASLRTAGFGEPAPKRFGRRVQTAVQGGAQDLAGLFGYRGRDGSEQTARWMETCSVWEEHAATLAREKQFRRAKVLRKRENSAGALIGKGGIGTLALGADLAWLLAGRELAVAALFGWDRRERRCQGLGWQSFARGRPDLDPDGLGRFRQPRVLAGGLRPAPSPHPEIRLRGRERGSGTAPPTMA